MSNPRVTRKRDMQQGVVYNAVQDDDDKWRPTVYKNTDRMQKVRVAQYESGKSYFLRYLALQVRTGSWSHGSPGNFRRAIYQEGSFRQDATLPGDPRIVAKPYKCLKKIVKMMSTCLFNNFIMFLEHFYDLERFTICRRLYCLSCYSLFRHIIDTYRPLACDERTETIQIACIRILLDYSTGFCRNCSEIIGEILIH